MVISNRPEGYFAPDGAWRTYRQEGWLLILLVVLLVAVLFVAVLLVVVVGVVVVNSSRC